MSEKTFKVVGISDSRNQWFPPDILKLVRDGKIFCGGKRHFEIIKDFLPQNHRWIDITVPLSDVWKNLEPFDDVTVFASGDPLFYGFAATLQREFPTAKLAVYPSFNSIQLLAHKLLLPYADITNVSLTGRPWDALDTALIMDRTLIGILTDKKKGPAEIANHLLDYGYDNYVAFVGENLGNEEKENVKSYSLKEVSSSSFYSPNCMILKMISPRKRYFGIPDNEFYHLPGREKMITKMPIRLLTLSMLGLPAKQSFWDIGFCTGSISIEAKLRFPNLNVTAFEVRPESEHLLKENCKKFGVPGIIGVITDFLDADLSSYPAPEAVFIGGHGGKLIEIIQKVYTVLKPNGSIVFNSVSQDSCRLFEEGIKSVGMSILDAHSITVDNYNTIKILKAQ